MYGANEQEVEEYLVEFTWMPQTVNLKLKATSINGVADKLEQIGKELDKLILQKPSYKKYLNENLLTFKWRDEEELTHISKNAFGNAIDINTKYCDYWLEDKKRELVYKEYKNQVPKEIVKIFEKYGFIWGGAWNKYQTCHFEYRPELLF